MKGSGVSMSDCLLWFSGRSSVWYPCDDEFSWCTGVVHVANFFQPSCSPEFNHLGQGVTVVEFFSNFFV